MSRRDNARCHVHPPDRTDRTDRPRALCAQIAADAAARAYSIGMQQQQQRDTQ